MRVGWPFLPGHRRARRAGFDAHNLTGGMAAWGTVYDTAELAAGSGHDRAGPPPRQGLPVLRDRLRRRGLRRRPVPRPRPLPRGRGGQGLADHQGVRHPPARRPPLRRPRPRRRHRRERAPQPGRHLRLRLHAAAPTATATSCPAASRCRSPRCTRPATPWARRSTSSATTPCSPATPSSSTGVGRPDLADRAEEFAHNLYRSLQERVLTLPDDAVRAARPLRRGCPGPSPPPGRRPARRAARHARAAPARRGRLRGLGHRSGPRPDPPTTSRSSRRTWVDPRPPSPCSHRLELGPNRCSAS